MTRCSDALPEAADESLMSSFKPYSFLTVGNHAEVPLRRRLLQSSMFLGLSTLLLACDPNQDGQDSSARKSSSRSAVSGEQGNSDLAVAITIPATWSNAKDIPVSWTAVEKATEYQLHIASDEACTAVSQSLRTRNNSSNISDLAE